ncbi:AAA family ATPase [Aurantiacibacter suaedae]|uniref:AAA family ATPase n=1 Tax=Aurantiacibacter suaedae TaxID=2545755 RepID=UPI0010F60E60|nr:AAA family ATPase [Aurantiacibacter suaedae]
MKLKRLQVDEGFLDGLDLQIDEGLNVLIGARGTGKTSIIELIRFVLGLENVVPESSQRSVEHAQAILGTGAVKLVYEEDGETRHISRAVNVPPPPQNIFKGLPPLVFSQREIEKIGLHPTGRLRLLDGFIEPSGGATSEVAQQEARIRSLTKEIANRQREINTLGDEVERLPNLRASLKHSREQQQAQEGQSAEIAQKSKQLDELSQKIALLSREIEELDRLDLELNVAYGSLSDATQAIEGDWLKTLNSDSSRAIAANVLDIGNDLRTATNRIDALSEPINSATNQARMRRGELEAEARHLRSEVEALSAGAGAIAATIQQLDAEIRKCESVVERRQARQSSIDQLKIQRAELLQTLEEAWQRTFEKRKLVAADINAKFAPLIKADVEQFGYTAPYSGLLRNMMQGSGIQYSEVSKKIASTVSPRELGEWVEDFDTRALAQAIGISEDRAAKIIWAISQNDLGDLFVLKVEDSVQFYLQDQSKHKPLNALSTGQQCTVILPIILNETGRVLIFDQPEDHIDNAFIVGTLVKSMRERAKDDQLLVASHNANIPVLGNATRVTQMGSTGDRGFLLVSNSLDVPEVVEAITNVMEGGIEAFDARSKFYHAEP